MWTLTKPDLQKAFDDIKTVIAASNGKLVAEDEPIIRMIYQTYDDNGGTIGKSDNYKLCGKQRRALYNLYNETGKVNRKPGKLYYIRRELMEDVGECPMCGICPPYQLDHQMPRSVYDSISVFRNNLVPICGICNNKKRTKESDSFVHPYYACFPKDVVFLIAKVDVDATTLRVIWKFGIDGSGINNSHLLEQINNQVSVIELFDRLRKASNTYLSEILYGRCFRKDNTLKKFLQQEYNKSLSLNSLNHWRTALLSSLCNNDAFNHHVANRFVNNIRPVNRGAGA